MMMFLENYYLDDILVALVGISAFVFVYILLKDSFITRIHIKEKTLEYWHKFSTLIEKSAAFVNEKFLCHIVNNGFISKMDITIDDDYLTETSSVFVKRGNF